MPTYSVTAASYSLIETQLQIKFLSPYAESILETVGQNLLSLVYGNGKTAFSRV